MRIKLPNLLLLMVMLVFGQKALADNVCKNTSTGTEYADIQSAIDAVEANQTIQLLSDVMLTSTIIISGTIDESVIPSETATPSFTLDLNGHVIDASNITAPTQDKEPPANVIQNYGNLTIIDSNPDAVHTQNGLTKYKGGILTGGKGGGQWCKNFGFVCTLYGGAILNCGNLTVSGITIVGNSAEVGGFLYSYDGTVNMTNCIIAENSATNFAGAIDAISPCILNLTNCIITGNTSTETAGISISQAKVTLDNCTITDNSATEGNGGGINNYGELTLIGKNIIKNNTSNGLDDNLCHTSSTPITLGALSEGSEIGIKTVNVVVNDDGHDISVEEVEVARQFTSNGSADYLQYFTQDNSDMETVYHNGYLELVVPFEESTLTTADLATWKDMKNNNVQLKRTLYKDGENNTLCLPFSLTAEQLAASPLAGYNKLQEFSSAQIVNKGEDNETLELTMTDATAIEAGKPYIIAWANADNIINPVFENVTITADEPSKSTASNGVQFCGTLTPFAMTANDKGYMFVGNNGQLNWPNVDGNLKAFRSYFTVDQSSNAKIGMTAYLVDGDATTSINTASTSFVSTKAKKLIEQGKVVIISNGKRYGLGGNEIK